MREVPLYGVTAAGRVSPVDDDDYELAMRHRWYVIETKRAAGQRTLGPYAQASIPDGSRQRTTRLHILIMGRPWIDHIDHDGLNNQRSNLRPATNGQNMANRRKNLGCSSHYKGVTWNKRLRKWVVQMAVDHKKLHLGCFADEVEAARAYDAAAALHFGEFALLNFPPDIPAGAVLLEPRKDTAA